MPIWAGVVRRTLHRSNLLAASETGADCGCDAPPQTLSVPVTMATRPERCTGSSLLFVDLSECSSQGFCLDSEGDRGLR